MGELPPRVQERLNQLSEKFRSELPSRIKEISALVTTAKTGNVPSLRELRNKVHRLAGTASTFGFDAVTGAARELESLVEHDLASPAAKLSSRTEEALKRLSESYVSPPETAEQCCQGRSRGLFLLADGIALAPGFDEQLAVFGYAVQRIVSVGEMVETVVENRDEVDTAVLVAAPDYFAGGIERLKALKDARTRLGDRLKLLLFARTAKFETRLRSVRYGADAFLELPVDYTRLADKLEELFTANEAEPFHVLVVDDDPDQVSETALILQDAGMITSVVSDPANLWQVLVDYQPELILMDMYMPKCNGVELASIIRQNESFVSVPIVFLSVETDTEKQLDAIRGGGDDFLTKPIDPIHLVTSVRIRASRTRAMRFYMERDSLTGLLNHTNLKNRLEHELERAMRIGTELTFVMLDIDKFKNVNDSYGHLTGDRVLKGLARLLQDRLRRTDVIGRYGGEEFAIILFNTNAEKADRIMNEIRENFSRISQYEGEREFFVTFSAGIAEYPRFDSAASLNEAADGALYEAKREGRNRVIVAGS